MMNFVSLVICWDCHWTRPARTTGGLFVSHRNSNDYLISPIDWLFSKLAAHWHQWRLKRKIDAYYDQSAFKGYDSSIRHEAERVYYVNPEIARWHELNPDKCYYCSYTRWANEERDQNLKIGPHRCIEGNSPPHKLPKAKVIKR